MHNLAVYGTLKRGYSNHDRHLHASILQGIDRVYGYILTNHGAFPAAVKASPAFSVVVEVYRVDDEALRKCDHLEGYYGSNNDYYTRIEVETRFGKTYMYIQKDETLTTYTKWFPGGNWKGPGVGMVQWRGLKEEEDIQTGKNLVAVGEESKELIVVGPIQKQEQAQEPPKKEQLYATPGTFGFNIVGVKANVRSS